MKSIKNKIQKPFLTLLILIPLATLILFNLSFRIYSNATAKNELKTTIRAVEKEIKSELETDGGQPSEKKALSMARNILMALKSSHFSQGMDFYLLDRDAKPVFPSQIKLAPSQIAYLDVIKDKYLKMNQGTVTPFL